MKSAVPSQFRPQLATLVRTPPEGDEWLHELKYDGYRIGAIVDGRKVRLLSRNGNDWTARFPAVAEAVLHLGARTALLDGEVTVVLPSGLTSFQALQNAYGGERGGGEIAYFVFDLLHLDGEDLAALPLTERKRRLKKLLSKRKGVLRYSDHIDGRGDEVFAQACRSGAEGIVSKRADQPYKAGRGPGWLKTKCTRRQELVIGGFTEPQGARAGLGALLVGFYEDGKLVYAGKVGTGFTQKSADELRRRLDGLEIAEAPFQPRPRVGVAGAHWVKPVLVGEVELTEWTTDGKIRHPSFKGLRADKEAKDVIRERAKSTKSAEAESEPAPPPKTPARAGKRAAADAEVAGVRISHPDRIVFPAAGLTKLDVALYYEAMADHILPHLEGRPLSLLRCPAGAAGECFYVKHARSADAPALRRVRIREKTKTGEYLVADSLDGVLGLVQMGVLELHTWNSKADDLEHPDRIVLDLDPGPKVAWPAVIAAARLVRGALEKLGLESFVKTTGSRGLHVVVPFHPKPDWETAHAFSQNVAASLVALDRKAYTTDFAKAGREAKILIDHMRNARGSTSVAAFSTRAKPKGPVSVPLTWEELNEEQPSDHLDIPAVLRRFARKRIDPWKGYWKTKQKVPAS